MLALNQTINLAFLNVNSSVFNTAFGFASWLFSPLPFTCLMIISVSMLWLWSDGKFSKRQKQQDVILFLAAPVMAFVAACALKLVTNIPRPLDAKVFAVGSSFPSAHTAVATAYFLIILHFAKRTKDPLRRAVHYAFCILCPVFVGVSRLYLEVHWFSDVLAGYAIGATAAYVAVKLFGVQLKHGK